jgi:PAS domain S-box-containing protein
MKKDINELEESGVRDEVILANIGDGLIVTDGTGKIVKINKAFSDMLGWEALEVHNKKLYDIVPNITQDGTEVAEKDRLITKTLLEKRKITSMDISYKRKDGSIFPVAITVSPIIFEDTVIGAVEIFKDITKEREYLNEVRRFQLAVESASDQIVMTDPEGTVIYANKALEKVTGFTSKEAIGKKAGALWGNLMEKSFYKNMWNTISVEKKSFSGQIKNKRKNGEIYHAEIHISPILNTNNTVQFFVAIERDITREKEIENIKDQFISSVSHELRAPMSAVKGLVSMLLKGDYGEMPDRFRQPLTNVALSAERQIHLINDLLNISRLQTGRMKFTLSDFSLSRIITEVVGALQATSRLKRITLGIEGQVDTLVQADDIWVKQILENIIGNAVKFTSEGNVIVSYDMQGDLVNVVVSDTGVGISPSGQEELFSKFQQPNTTVLNKTIGSGLGLYISREVARKMGGEVSLRQSEPGKGSVFAVSLPKAGSSTAQQAKSKLEKGEALALNKNIGE